MYIYVYIHIYIYIYVYVNVFIFSYIYAYVYVYIYKVTEIARVIVKDRKRAPCSLSREHHVAFIYINTALSQILYQELNVVCICMHSQPAAMVLQHTATHIPNTLQCTGTQSSGKLDSF